MGRPSPEALLISALLVNGDVTEAAQFGITAAHFRGYSAEFSWLQHYYETYGESPSQDDFFHKFPDFPFRSNTNTRYAADEVLRDHARARITENISTAISSMQNDDLTAAMEVLRSFDYTPTTAVPADLVTSLGFLDNFDDDHRGLPVPWPTLQHATDGIRPGNFWIFGARLGQGKSAFLCDIAVKTLLGRKKVLYYSLEMSEEELRARVHANLATHFGYSGLTAMGILRRQVDLREYKQFVTELPDRLGEGVLHVHTPADGPVSPAVIASRAGEYDLVVIDYLTLMHTDAGVPASDDWRTATQISNRVKQVALATGTPILAAAQINRDGDIGDNPPKIKNLAQSDSLGQDGDVVVTLRTKPEGAAAVLSLQKNRHGPSGHKWWTKFDVNHGVFDEISEEKAEDLSFAAQEMREGR